MTTRNHIGKCTCPKGVYKGDPYNSGCQKVNCVENDDCPANEYCDRLSYTCRSVGWFYLFVLGFLSAEQQFQKPILD